MEIYIRKNQCARRPSPHYTHTDVHYDFSLARVYKRPLGGAVGTIPPHAPQHTKRGGTCVCVEKREILADFEEGRRGRAGRVD